MAAALDAALPWLRCPVCEAGLARETGTVRCANRHAFDVSRQGYVSLLRGAHPHRGDTAAMIGAREEFLASGHYATIAATVVEAVEGTAPDGPVLDLAAGTGWYSARVLDSAPERAGVAVDVSTAALQRAARIHPRLAAVGADAWGVLPCFSEGFAVVLSVFGPRTADEIARVLMPAGVVVTVTPTPRHLAAIVGPLGMLDVGGDKPARLREAFAAFEEVGSTPVEHAVALDHAQLAALVGMGPTGHHQDPEAIRVRVAELPPQTAVTVSVDVTTFRRR